MIGLSSEVYAEPHAHNKVRLRTGYVLYNLGG